MIGLQLWFQSRDKFHDTTAPKRWHVDQIRYGYLYNKPKGGLWTSSFVETEHYLSDWHKQGSGMFGNLGKAWLLSPIANIKHYTIDTLHDLYKLWNRYYFIDDRFPPDFSYHKPFDFVSFFRDYDALQLTKKGQWRTRLTDPYNFYGWDSECTLWSKWLFKKAIPINELSYLDKKLIHGYEYDAYTN